MIGSFALQRRIVTNYNDYAPVLREAVVSTEDKTFLPPRNQLLPHRRRRLFTISHPAAKCRVHRPLPCSSRAIYSSPPIAAGNAKFRKPTSPSRSSALTKQQIFTLYANQISWPWRVRIRSRVGVLLH